MRLWRDNDNALHLAPRLKKGKSYTSTPPLGHRGLFWVNFNLYSFHNIYTYIIQHYIQGVSRLVDITAGGDFLGLCD
jgi:hypothetical protein